MTAARLAISIEPALAKRIRKAAGREPISAWLADAAQRKLRAEGMLEVVRAWEAEHGELSEAELRKAAAKQSKRAVRRRR
jgi:hypothetical protein